MVIAFFAPSTMAEICYRESLPRDSAKCTPCVPETGKASGELNCESGKSSVLFLERLRNEIGDLLLIAGVVLELSLRDWL